MKKCCNYKRLIRKLRIKQEGEKDEKICNKKNNSNK